MHARFEVGAALYQIGGGGIIRAEHTKQPQKCHFNESKSTPGPLFPGIVLKPHHPHMPP